MHTGTPWLAGLMLVVTACAARPTPVIPAPSSPPVVVTEPKPLLTVFRLEPDGTSAELGHLPPGPEGFTPPDTGNWYAEPLRPVRTEAEAREVAAVLREHRVRELSFGVASVPAPGLLAALLQESGVVALQLSGTNFGNAHLASLENATQLEALHLNATRVTDAGLAPLKRMQQLAVLRLDETPVSDAGLAPLSEHTTLRRVTLAGTAVTSQGLGFLARQPGLEELDLSDTAVDDTVLAVLPGAPLHTLNLSGTKVTDAGLRGLSAMPTLRRLGLARTAASDASLAHVAGLRELEALHLGSTQVTDAGLLHLAKLPALRALVLSKARIRGAGLRHLAGLSRLEALHLDDTRVGDSALRHLRGLNELRELDLSRTAITGTGLQELSTLVALESLWLSGLALTDDSLTALAPLSQLTRLALSHTPIGPEGLNNLGSRPLLRHLELSKTGFTDEWVPSIRQAFPGLHSLKAERTLLTDVGLGQFAEWTELEAIHVAGTLINGSSLTSLHTLARLTTLDLGATRLDAEGQKALQGFTNLVWLSVAGVHTSDEMLGHLPSSLRTLYLTRTKVTDAGLPALHKLPHLRELDLRGTAVSTEARSALARERGIHLITGM
ncbi:hypothetical protein MVI01_26490 [Myxococcus virescens]|uniref:Leucine Rich repeat n=1 Tax=Myxococcus virescens TaxID=83456 RepID=A0A511HBM2_9BACT|nr:hypothetical protein MVI01_26490 [Myxococcus virescens]SDE21745.1 Leucine Rich repeat [Myxococcus virescens]